MMRHRTTSVTRALANRLAKFEAQLAPDERRILRLILEKGGRQEPEDPSESFIRKLARFTDGLDDRERGALWDIVKTAGRRLLSHAPELPRGSVEFAAMRAASVCLAQLMPGNTTVWRGRPAEVTDRVLRGLKRDAASRRAHAEQRRGILSASPGPAAERLRTSRWLTSLVRTVAGPWKPSGASTWIYYEKAGDGVSPHVDRAEYSLNVLLCVEHVWRHEPRSRLVIYPPGEPSLRLQLEPGELVIFPSRRMLHGREDLRRDEAVTMLSFGFTDR